MTSGWVLTRRRASGRFVRKVGVWSLIAIILLLTCSIADDVRTCSLHRVPFAQRPLQISLPTTDDQVEQTAYLTCQRQVVSGAIVDARPLLIKMQMSRVGVRAPAEPTLVHPYFPQQDRAPPFRSRSLQMV